MLMQTGAPEVTGSGRPSTAYLLVVSRTGLRAGARVLARGFAGEEVS
jgi:hypothetical protein